MDIGHWTFSMDVKCEEHERKRVIPGNYLIFTLSIIRIRNWVSIHIYVKMAGYMADLMEKD